MKLFPFPDNKRLWRKLLLAPFFVLEDVEYIIENATCRMMAESDIDRVVPLYIEHYNTYKGGAWTSETTCKRIHQVWSREDSLLNISCVIPRRRLQKIHDRPQDRCSYLFFHRDGQDIGFAMPVIYTTEDGKCFIMEFCVYPAFRGSGTGVECAGVLLNWAREHGMLYAELNCSGDLRRVRFWQRMGFIRNGADEWGEPLMILPPKENVPITVEILADPEDWRQIIEERELPACFWKRRFWNLTVPGILPLPRFGRMTKRVSRPEGCTSGSVLQRESCWLNMIIRYRNLYCGVVYD